MQLFLIRHGMTKGNLEKRYIGCSDEVLCQEGIRQLEEKRNAGIYREIPSDAVVWCSPKKRCIQTAQILFGKREIKIEDRLRECEFGDWEGKNYMDLRNDPRYQKWIDSGGTISFPNGEEIQAFKERSVQACREILRWEQKEKNYVFVVHGGTIMAILEQFGYPKKGYYDYQCSNGEGYICVAEQDENNSPILRIQRRLQ